MTINKIREKTIKDFNAQWNLQGVLNEDYWASEKIITDQFSMHISPKDIENKIIADVGAGSGRLLKTLYSYKPKKYYAIEPSENGSRLIKQNFGKLNNMIIIQKNGSEFKTPELCDYIFSLGVIHHIKNPIDTLKNIKKNLKVNGKIIIWVYGFENNQLYILIYKFLSIFTKRLPDKIVYLIASILNLILIPYIFLCKFIKLPLASYFLNVFNKCGWSKRNDIIFDQLNPAYSKYYKKNEIERELIDSGFSNLKIHHKDKYSWSVIAENI